MPRPKKSDQSKQHTKRMSGARKKKEGSDAKKAGARLGKMLSKNAPLFKAAKKRAELKMKKRGIRNTNM
jgi:hypothetical protein